MVFQTRKIPIYNDNRNEYVDVFQYKLRCQSCNRVYYANKENSQTCSTACRMMKYRKNKKLGKSKRK